MPADGFFEQVELSTELVALAEASLALGDAAAALRLLAQVEDSCRNNFWIATQVEALRLIGELEECRTLALISLETMIEHRDWTNGRKVLITGGRVFSDLQLTREFIDYLHSIEVHLRSIENPDLLFSIQLLTMMAARIGWEGDVRTASAIMDLFAPRLEEVRDRRSRANFLWVQAELNEMSGDFELAFNLMDSVIPILQEENDSQAAFRAIAHLGWLVTAHVGFQVSFVHRAGVNLSAALQQNRGNSSMVFIWIRIYLVRVNVRLGNIGRAIELLEELPKVNSHDYEVGVFVQISWAEYNIKLENRGQAKLHLDNARIILQPNIKFGDHEIMGIIRQLVFLYSEINEPTTAMELLDFSEAPQADYSRYLPHLKL